jgi:membrane protein YqaA with SNARE-associated domain
MFIKKRATQLIYSKNMLTGIGVASFLESMIVPIPLEALLVPLMQKRREKLWIIATVTTLGCMAGALLGYAIGYFLFDIFRDFIMYYITTEQKFENFQNSMIKQGFWFVFSTGITPIPLQVAMLTAGLSKYSLGLYMLAVTSSRIIRYYGLAVLVYFFGDEAEKLVHKYKWQAIVVGIAIALLFFGLPYWLDY